VFIISQRFLAIILIYVFLCGAIVQILSHNQAILKKTVYAQKERNVAYKPFFGVNMRGYYTSSVVQNRQFGSSHLPVNYYEDSFKAISKAGMNLVRYLLYWEAYEKNPSLFIKELDTVANTADKWGLKVIYDNDQYHTSSWLEPDRGYGFPSSLFEDNPKYDYGGGGGVEGNGSEGAKVWWTDWWNRSIKDGNGNDGWILQLGFLKKIINTVNKHNSTIGYEILNEPQIYSVDQWEKIGKYNTFIVDQLRKVTQKIILFDRQVPPDLWGPIDTTPENMAKMAPSNKTNVVFKVTLFGLPLPGSSPEARLTTYTKTAQIAGVPLCMCEFSLRLSKQYHPATALNQTLANLFIQKFQEAKLWGWAAWIWDFMLHSEEGIQSYNLVNFKSNKMQTTKNFEYIKEANLKLVSNVDRSDIPVENITDTISPTVAITLVNVVNDKTEHGQKILQIEGQAIDIGSGIRSVEVKLDNQAYVTAQPTLHSRDWLNWAVSLPSITKTKGISHKVTAKASDNEGHLSYVSTFLDSKLQ
jgi:Cellulase (glycosyl hydrolase family 5)